MILVAVVYPMMLVITLSLILFLDKKGVINNMCSIFGTTIKDLELLKNMGIAGEVRGTDATGAGYSMQQEDARIGYVKNAVKASKFNWQKLEKVVNDSKALIGHTRKTTKGNEKFGYNNHPFMSSDNGFLITHNGVINNDTKLKKEKDLPKTKIQTDSYVILQLLDNLCYMNKQYRIDIEIVKEAVEMLSGSFALAILDYNRLYLLRHKNPLHIIYNGEELIYASTKDMLREGISNTLGEEEDELTFGSIITQLDEDVIYEFDLSTKKFSNRAEFEAKSFVYSYGNTGFSKGVRNFYNRQRKRNKKKHGVDTKQNGLKHSEYMKLDIQARPDYDYCSYCQRYFYKEDVSFNNLIMRYVCNECNSSIKKTI